MAQQIDGSHNDDDDDDSDNPAFDPDDLDHNEEESAEGDSD
jgi:hypothetical protein